MAREAQVPSGDRSEIVFMKGEGVGHGRREKDEARAFTKPLGHPLPIFDRSIVVCLQKDPAPERISQGARLLAAGPRSSKATSGVAAAPSPG